MAYDNTNTGTLWKNDKGNNPKRPDFKGSIDINGVPHWICSWVRESSDTGEKFHAIKVTPKDAPPLAQQMNAQARQAQGPARQVVRIQPEDDDIGF